MKTLIQRTIGLFTVIFMLSIMPQVSLAAAKRVPVTLPSFNITLNGVKVDNESRTFPLITYQNITYVPMTYWDARFLGLETRWSGAEGLTIYQGNNSDVYKPDQIGQVESARKWATIATGKIQVNGKKIDNTKEAYPLLIYKDVTYFPLTWRFMVEEFGWQYTFDPATGLKISVEGMVIQLPIANRSWNETYEPGAWTMVDNYIYYEGAKGVIYRISLSEDFEQLLSDIKAGGGKPVYSLPIHSYGDGNSYVRANLQTIDGQARLTYHQGGAIMGADYTYVFEADGTPTLFDSGYSTKKVFGDLAIRINQGMPSDGNNLTIKKTGQENYVTVGNSDYLYGWIWEVKDGSMGGAQSQDLELIGEDIYVLGYLYNLMDDGETTGIYKINLTSQETTRIGKDAVQQFKIQGEWIYYRDWAGYLCRIRLDGTNGEKLTSWPIADFVCHGNKVYYVSTSQNPFGRHLWAVGNSQPIHPGQVDYLSVQDGYLVCTFSQASPTKDRILVLDTKGEIVFQSIVESLSVRVDNGKVAYMSTDGPTIYIKRI